MILRKILWLTLVTPALVGVVFVIHRIVTVPENHVGLSPWLLAAGAVPALIAAALLPTGWRVAAALIAVANVAIVAMAIHFNFLLQYEDWIDRGMPEKPTFLGSSQK